MRAHVLYTVNRNGKISNLWAAFTDDRILNSWAADWLNKHPNERLYDTALLLNPAPREMKFRPIDDGTCAILYTVARDYEIDQVFALFTEDDALTSWAEDFLKTNPHKELYFFCITVPLNPKT